MTISINGDPEKAVTTGAGGKLLGALAEALVTSYDGLASKLQPLDIRAGVIAGTKSSDFTRKMFSGANEYRADVSLTPTPLVNW